MALPRGRALLPRTIAMIPQIKEAIPQPTPNGNKKKNKMADNTAIDTETIPSTIEAIAFPTDVFCISSLSLFHDNSNIIQTYRQERKKT